LTGLYAEDIQETCQFIGIFDTKIFSLKTPMLCALNFHPVALRTMIPMGKPFIGGKIHLSRGEIHPWLSFLSGLEFALAQIS
jgi:hypothetical protein